MRVPGQASLSHVGAFVLGIVVATAVSAGADSSSRRNKSRFAALDTFAQALSTISNKYVTAADERELIYGALSGMTTRLDSYSLFYSPERYKRMRQDTDGEYGGVGITTLADSYLSGMVPHYPRIGTVVPGSPAARAGIQPGDRLLAVGGRRTNDEYLGKKADDWLSVLRGRPGTEVQILVAREAWPRDRFFTLRRERIKTPSVAWFSVEPGIGYIAISRFQDATTADTQLALTELSRAGMRALILDLRNNPGGLVDQAVSVADLFLDKGVIVSIRGRIGTELEQYKAHKAGARSQLRVLVLIDENTASAAEIVAGALKDHGRARLFGATTFGKGSVQTFYDMDDGSGLKLTTAYYLTPGGRALHERGISPDVYVDKFDPEVIFGRASRPGGPASADDLPDGEAEKAARPGQEQIPKRLRDDLQFETAHQTVRGWLGSKPTVTGDANQKGRK